MGIVTTSSKDGLGSRTESIYDFVTNPANWPKTYPGSAHITDLPSELALPDALFQQANPARIDAYHRAIVRGSEALGAGHG